MSYGPDRIIRVTQEIWRPLDLEDDESIAEYDALHDGVPEWMCAPYWAWVRDEITQMRRVYTNSMSGSYSQIRMLNVTLVEQMCLALKLTLPNLRSENVDYSTGRDQLNGAMKVLRAHTHPLQVADYLLAHRTDANSQILQDLLDRAKSARTLGQRAGRPGLIRRVPLGAQIAADDTMARAGQAGVRLANAWEALYGLSPDPSIAYGHAIKAVEDASIPVVSPKNTSATLGTVIRDMEQQGDWKLPMDREHDKAPTGPVLVSMMRVLWHGQHDRHGGQPSAPGNVSVAEASVAVGLAVTLVSWFDAGLPTRAT